MAKHIFIDYETKSSIDLSTHGLRRYVDAEDFEPLLLAVLVSSGGGLYHAQVYESEGGRFPESVEQMLLSEDCIKHAWNAQFERVVTEKMLGIKLDPRFWRCTMAEALYCGLPGSLSECAKALGLPQQKDARGASLIRKFTMPRKPTKSDPRIWHTRQDLDCKESWGEFREYVRQDAVVEFMVYEALPIRGLPAGEDEIYALDQLSNELGVAVDIEFAKRSDAMYARYKAEKKQEVEEKHGISNINSVEQVKKAIERATGVRVESIRKDVAAGLSLGQADEILRDRAAVSKSSCAKYAAAVRATSKDGRLRGTSQYYGANRTGRYAGRMVQLHNQPRQTLPHLDKAREAVNAEDSESVELIWGSVPQTLSELIRAMFVAAPGNKLVALDFSAIEARVLSWLANERWRLDVFATHGKIYEASAARMFGIDIALVTKSSAWRDKGKIAELALGFGGGVAALKRFGADRMGLSENEMSRIVTDWRNASPAIVKFWKNCEKAAADALKQFGTRVYWRPDLVFQGKQHDGRKWLSIRLPSGRELMYYEPEIVPGKFGGRTISYAGMAEGVEGRVTKKWGRVETYGGKLTENIVQAVARDCLVNLARRVYSEQGALYVFHVHDELVYDVPAARALAFYEDLVGAAAVPPEWAPGLPLRGEGFVADVYKKE